MKGKILIALIALGATSAVLANGGMAAPAPVAEPNYFDGLYLGLGAGVQHQTGNVKNATVDVWSDTVTSFRSTIQSEIIHRTSVFASALDSDVGNTAINGELFAGYGKTFNSLYYAGIELYAKYANAKTESNYAGVPIEVSTNTDTLAQSADFKAAATSIDLKSDFSYGAALKFGYLITPKTMFYILAGIEHTKFDVDVNHSFAAGHSQTPDTTPTSNWSRGYSYHYGFDENKWAFVPGVGIETMLTDKLSLSAQYTYADYGNISHHNDLPPTVLAATPVGSGEPFGTTHSNINAASPSDTKFDLSRGLFSLRLAYHFNGI